MPDLYMVFYDKSVTSVKNKKFYNIEKDLIIL